MFPYYYHSIFKKYITAFGTLFNNIYIKKTVDTNVIKTLKVPITYSPKQSFIVRLLQDPNLDRKDAITYPAMGFEIKNYSYDSQRKLNSLNSATYLNEITKTCYQHYTPIPYNITFELNIVVKDENDVFQILEQILPAFDPSLSVTINDIVPGINQDIIFEISSSQFEDSYATDFKTQRKIIHTLTFNCRGFFYKPLQLSYVSGSSESSGIIKKIILDFKPMKEITSNTAINDMVSTYDELRIYPQIESNTSISYQDINATDDYIVIQDGEVI